MGKHLIWTRVDAQLWYRTATNCLGQHSRGMLSLDLPTCGPRSMLGCHCWHGQGWVISQAPCMAVVFQAMYARISRRTSMQGCILQHMGAEVAGSPRRFPAEESLAVQQCLATSEGGK